MIMKTIIKTLAFSLLVLTSSGCAKMNATPLGEKSTTEIFVVSPKELTQKDLIKINLPIIRPKNLAIVDPKGQWFIIQNADSNILMMPQKDFMQINLLSLPINNTTGFTWIDGEKTEQIIFKKTGRYRVYFADNLETEAENTFTFSAYITVK